jgi:hypothetical protein
MKAFTNPNPSIITLSRENKFLYFVVTVLICVHLPRDMMLTGQIFLSVYFNIHITRALAST